MRRIESWNIVDLLIAFLLVFITSIGLLFLDSWVLEIPFQIFFDLSVTIIVYGIFVFRYKLKISEILGAKYINFLPMFLIFQIVVLLFRIIVSNGLGDLFMLVSEFQSNYVDLTNLFTLEILSRIFIAPTWEEFVFRYVIFWILYRKFNLTIAMIAPSLLFAGLHITPEVISSPSALLISTLFMIFGESLLKLFVVFRTKSILIPLLMHIFNNCVSEIISRLYFQLGF